MAFVKYPTHLHLRREAVCCAIKKRIFHLASVVQLSLDKPFKTNPGIIVSSSEAFWWDLFRIQCNPTITG